jgi:hypothetical protein
MPGPRDQIRASRVLLAEVCALMSAHADDAVLIGGWVPDVRFPDARPAHVGSIDVDFALRLERSAHAAVVALLLRNGFRPGAHSYQFLKDVALGNGRTIPARLDLLTSVRHHAETHSAANPMPLIPFAVPRSRFKTTRWNPSVQTAPRKSASPASPRSS